MRQLVLVLPDAHLAEAALAHADHALQLPGLARIARFARAHAPAQDWHAWLARWSGRPDLATVAPAVIAATGVSEPLTAAAGSVWCAQPLHWIAGLNRVHLPPQGLLRLDEPTQHSLCAAFNEAFGPHGCALRPLGTAALLAVAPCLDAVDTTDPMQLAVGTDLAQALPQGPGAAALRRLTAEIEMWLHQHPLNVARERGGAVPISTLWLWGGGAPRTLSRSASSDDTRLLYSSDAYVQALASLARVAHTSVPPGLAALGATQAHAALVCLPLQRLASHELRDPAAALGWLDRHWIAPAAAAVGRGGIGELVIVTLRRVSVLGAHSRLKLWRRTREPLAVLQ